MDNHMAIDQYGETYHDLGRHPRATLLARLDRQHADKMYIDSISTGKSRHCGYIIAGRWLTLYKVEPINIEVKK